MIKDYDDYQFIWYEYIEILGSGCFMILIVSYLFYENLVGSIFLSPYLIIYFHKSKKNKIKRRKQMLSSQFKDALLSIATGLEAGYSIETSFVCALKDLSLIYDKKSYIIPEIQHIVIKMKVQIPIELALEDFSNRCKIPDIQCFYQVFACAKRTGGDMIQIIQKTCRTISDKMETYREIETMITAKKFELTIMKCIPFAILAYLKICNGEFLSPLYHNLFGYLFMSTMLIMIASISKLSENIMNIEI